MSTLKDFRDERLRKLADLQALGFNAYPAETTRTHRAQEIKDAFENLEGSEATVAGRIMGIRKFGKLAFIVLRDQSGEIQLFIQEGNVAPRDAAKGVLALEDLPLLDTGDFLEATGPVIKTKTGEISIQAARLRLLTKALRPMPSAVEGFTNKEERMRRRYIDMNVSCAVRSFGRQRVTF